MLNERLLNEHLIFEFSEDGFREKTSLLLEMYGAVTNIRYYLDIIQKKFLETDGNEIVLKDEDFPLGTFKNLEIVVRYNENFQTRPIAKGRHSYTDGKLTITIDTESYNKKSAIPKIRKVVGHEMIHNVHAEGLRKTYGDETTFDDFEKFYDGAVYFLEHGDMLEKNFGSILYHLADSEKNAFIGQTFTELEQYADHIIDDSTAKKAITKTETYVELDNLDSKIRKLRTYSMADKNYLITAFNRFTGLNYTFDMMMEWIERRFYDYVDKFFEQACKMANFYYQENVKKTTRTETFDNPLDNKHFDKHDFDLWKKASWNSK